MSGLAAVRARWIAQLGDLAAIELPGQLPLSVREAGKLRRDHPGLTHAQLAEQMGVSTRTFERHLRIFLDLVACPV